MTSLNMSELYKEAQESGVTNSLLPTGPANLIITRTNVTPPAQGKDGVQFGMFVKITDGPHAGVQGWWNQNIGPSNPVGNGIFFRILDAFGLTADWYTHEAVTLEMIGEALVGRPFSGVISNRSGKDNIPRWNDVKSIKLLTAEEAAAPQAEAPAVVAAPAPAVAPAAPAVPAPEAPAPAVVAAPAAPAAPQAVAAPPAPAAPAVADVPAAPAAPAQPAVVQAAAPAVQTGPDGLPVPPTGVSV